MTRTTYIAVRRGQYSPDGTPEHTAGAMAIMDQGVDLAALQKWAFAQPVPKGWINPAIEVLAVSWNDPELVAK